MITSAGSVVYTVTADEMCSIVRQAKSEKFTLNAPNLNFELYLSEGDASSDSDWVKRYYLEFVGALFDTARSGGTCIVYGETMYATSFYVVRGVA